MPSEIHNHALFVNQDIERDSLAKMENRVKAARSICPCKPRCLQESVRQMAIKSNTPGKNAFPWE